MSDEKTTKDTKKVDETISTQAIPYPTGSPPEAPGFADFHPQEARALELEKAAAAAAAKPAAKAEPAKAEPKAAKAESEEDEDDDPTNRYGKGRK